MRQAAHGFTLLELLVTLLILALVVSLAVPMLGNGNRVRVIAASSVLASDIECAQSLTMAHPAAPVVVRLDSEGARYWLAAASDPETPIARPDTDEPYLVKFGEGRARGAHNVSMTLAQVASNTLSFDAQGGLVDFTATPSITLTCQGQAITLTIAPNTGSITETASSAP